MQRLHLLCHDMKRYLAGFFTLATKRNLLTVCKWCYWWMKPYLVIRVVPDRGMWQPGPCLVCYRNGMQKITMPAKPVAHAHRQSFLECVNGHRMCLHVKDLTKDIDIECPKCDARLIYRVVPKRVIKVNKKTINIY